MSKKSYWRFPVLLSCFVFLALFAGAPVPVQAGGPTKPLCIAWMFHVDKFGWISHTQPLPPGVLHTEAVRYAGVLCWCLTEDGVKVFGGGIGDDSGFIGSGRVDYDTPYTLIFDVGDEYGNVFTTGSFTTRVGSAYAEFAIGDIAAVGDATLQGTNVHDHTPNWCYWSWEYFDEPRYVVPGYEHLVPSWFLE